MQTIFEILHKIGLNLVTKKFQDEKVDIKGVMSASDEDLIRLGARTVGDKIRLREVCRRAYTANSSLRPLDISQGISWKSSDSSDRITVNTGSSNSNTGSSNRRAADRTWTGQFLCLSDIHVKKIPTPTEKVVLQKAGLGFKKIKFDLEADEVSVYNQLTSSSSGNSQSDELTSGYSQLQNCGGFELMKSIPNCKVLVPLECQISAKHLKATAGQGKIYITGLQKLGARSRECTYRAPKTLIRYTKKRAPKINSDVYCINHRKELLHLLKLKSISEKHLLYIPNK